MAGWFDNLKSIFNIKVDMSGLKSVHFDLLSGNRDNVLVKIEKKELRISIAADVLSDPAKKEQIQEVLRAVVDENGHPLLEAHAASTVENITSDHQYEELLVYFEDKIPLEDVTILRAALYIRRLHEEGKHVDSFKQDIVSRFGQRGANIANLCSAGYFESHLKPMYEELKERPNFTPQMFIDNYNLIIDKALLAVFVSGAKSEQELEDEVGSKLLTNRTYGIHRLNIHAIGSENVRKLKDLIQNPTISQHFTADPAISIEGNIMNVQIFF